MQKTDMPTIMCHLAFHEGESHFLQTDIMVHVPQGGIQVTQRPN